MSFANKKKVYVATYKEIAVIFVVFSVILFVLYPQKLLYHQILTEKYDYGLGIVYLKNMLHSDPNNPQLKLDLGLLYLKDAKPHMAMERFKPLLHHNNLAIRLQAYEKSYDAAKVLYFNAKKNEKKALQNTLLKPLFAAIMHQGLYDRAKLKKWYGEAIFLGDIVNAYLLQRQRALFAPDNININAELFYLAQRLHHFNVALNTLHRLESIDTKERNQWIMNEYYLLSNQKQYDAVEQLLIKNSEVSPQFKALLANFYLNRKKYLKSANLYLSLVKKTKAEEKKSLYLLKALQALRAGNYTKKAADIGYSYQSEFIHVKKVRIYLLQLYFATNQLQKAVALSKKILKMQR
jgi:hypothetical protein